jgi:hypothetical protein
MTAEEFDTAADFAAKPKRMPTPADATEDMIPNGTYTLSFPSGEWKTFRIRTEKNGDFRGKRTIAILTGPDNTTEFEKFGFVDAGGVKTWKRYAGSKFDQYGQIIWSLSRGEELDGYEVRVAKRCMRCNRIITTPSSIDANYGPECATKAG